MIGGKALDASALAAMARRRHSALVWFDIAPALGLTLYLPSLALTEVRAVRPDAAPLLADLLTHPSVIVGELDATTAEHVDRLLMDADVFDALAGHVVHTAHHRGWPGEQGHEAVPQLAGCPLRRDKPDRLVGPLTAGKGRPSV